MATYNRERSETISAALKLTDPESTLPVGSLEQRIVMEHLRDLWDKKGTGMLDEIESRAELLREQVHVMVMKSGAQRACFKAFQSHPSFCRGIRVVVITGSAAGSE